MFITQVKMLVVAMIALVTVAGCSNDGPPFKISVDPRFGIALDEANGSIQAWNELTAPRQARAFDNLGERADSYDPGDVYDDRMGLYCLPNAEIPADAAGQTAIMLRVADLPLSAKISLGSENLPTARSLSFTVPPGYVVVGLASPRDDALVFCEMLAGSRDPSTFTPDELQGYLTVIKKVALHELGHVLGLSHIEDYAKMGMNVPKQPDVMNADVNEAETLSAFDSDMYCKENDTCS